MSWLIAFWARGPIITLTMEYKPDPSVNVAVGSISAVCISITVVGYLWMVYQHRRNHWHHGVRLPSLPERHHWYQVALSIGCRPWAGHEGDVFIKLIGTKGQGDTFLINNEVHPRLYEAESQIFLYASARPLGEIKYVIMACGATQRRKRFFLSSVQVKYVANEVDKDRYWYFPYHEWIEVFLEPVKVTLCGVDPHHDLNRRLLLGWLSRGVSDFHLWLSIFGPLKYTQFRRADRFLCSGAHAAGSVICCVYLNGWIPDLGRVVLGIFSSASVAVSVYVIEWCLRMTNRKPKVIIEEISWYRDRRRQKLKRILSYDQFRKVVATEHCDIDKIACKRANEDSEIRRKEFEAYRDIMKKEHVFWRWLTDGGRLEVASFLSLDAESYMTADESLPIMTKISVKALKCCMKTRAILKVLCNWFRGKAGHGPYADAMGGGYDVEGYQTAPYGGKIAEPKINIIAEMIKAAKAASQEALPIQAAIQAKVQNKDVPLEKWEKKWIDLNQKNFHGEPNLLWRVDSQYSIFSLEMERVDFDRFSLIESMPVGDFDLLREGKRPLLGWLNEAESQYFNAMGDSSHIENHVYRKLVPKVKPILLPPSIQRLTHEEGQLVCMIYFDLLTKGYQWCTPGVPDQLFDQRNTDIKPCTDWMKLDIASKQDLTGNWKPIDFKGRGRKNIQARTTMTEMNLKYPEPIPRQRIFSMLMFSEYAKKLSDAYEEMLDDPEMHSCMSEMFAMFSESKEGPLMFGEACLQLSQYDTGRQAICHLLSAARKSPAWAQMILDLAQRLRFQGDNIKRIREKYGLQADCHIKTAKGEIPYEVKCFDAACDDDCKPLKFDRQGNLVCDTKIKSKCIYYELDRMTAWNKKLAELGIPQKDCPMGQLPQSDITKLSRFFRSMVLSEDGCMMFSELILQVNAGGRQGADSIARVLRFVTQADDGVKRFIGFHREIGESGKLGRRLLLRWYNAVKRQPPHGYRILQKLADHLATIPLGRMLIEDLQVDGKKAHVIARQIKSEIHQHLDPFVKSTARNLKHTILRLNEMAKSLLNACDHAKSVLDGEGELPFKTHMETKFSDSAEKLDDAAAMNDPEYGTNGPPWMSKITCCRNYKDLVAKLNEEQKKPQSTDVKKPDDFPWTPDDVSLSCIYANEPKESEKLLSKRWVPIDNREKINIYQRESPSQKLLRERMLKLLAEKKKASKIKKGDCVGFNAPCCRRLNYCLARERDIYNQFFLQTKDYEKFYMNFSFRPTGFRRRLSDIEGRLGGEGAFSVRSKSSLAWEAHKEGYHQNPMYYGRHRKWEEVESAAELWGRKVVYDDNGNDDDEQEVEPEKNSIRPCVCTHGKCIYTCLVCSIARQITETKDPKKMVSIVTDNTKGAPQVSTSDMQTFPDYEDVVLAKPLRPTEIEHKGFAKQQYRQSLRKEKTTEGKKEQISEKNVEAKKAKDSQSRRRVKEAPKDDNSSWKINMKQGLPFPRPNPSAKAHVSEYVITPAQNVRQKRGKLHIPSISTASSGDTSSTSLDNVSSPESAEDEEKGLSKEHGNVQQPLQKSSPPSPDCCRNKLRQCHGKHDDSFDEKVDEGTEKKEEELSNKPQWKLPGPCRLDQPRCPCDVTKAKQIEIMERRDKVRHAEESRKAKREENQSKGRRQVPPIESEDDGERHCPRLPFPSAGYDTKLRSRHNNSASAALTQTEYYSEISEIFDDGISERSTTANINQLEDTKSPFPSSGCCKNKFEVECPCVDETEQSKRRRRNKHESERILAMYTKQEADYPDPDKDNLIKLDRTGCGKDCIGKVAKAPGRPYPITAKNFKTVENAKNPLSATAKKALELIKERELKETQLDNGYVKPKNAGVDFLDGALESESDGLSDPMKMMEEIEYCQVCGGVVSLKRVKDLTYAYRYFVKRQGDDETPDESMSNVTLPDDVSDPNANWEQAKGCCRRPGCRNKLPKGAHLRRIPQREKEQRENRYLENKKKLEKDMFNRFKQWLPPGRHSLPNAKDKEVLEFAPDIDGAYHSDSYVTAVSCFRPDDSSESNSIDSMDKLVRSVSKRPVISRKAKLMKFRQFLNQTCDLHKLPRFACCRLHDSKWMNCGKGEDEKDLDEKEAKYMKNFSNPPLSCICHQNPSVSVTNDSASAAHSICSECHIRIGTQQKPQPPCSRYLLPLKAVRCYEEALKAHADEQNQSCRVRAPSVHASDSGLETAIDVIDSDDMSEINNVQNQTLLDLMGLSKRPGPRVKTFAGHLSPASSYVSLNSTLQSSGVCCHVNRARRLPILHLQGFGCDPASKFPFGDGYQPLSITWWKEHDSALRFVQECADACVRFRVLVARSREEALTDHERTCKVCVPHDGMGLDVDLEKFLPHDDDGIEMIGGTVLGVRYSEMLPVVWRPQVREDGITNEPLQIEKRRIRFYRQLIQAVVESTRMLILTPDITPPKSKSKTVLYQRYTNDFSSSDTTDTEATATSGHVIRLSHYRAMTKSFNGLLKAVNKIKNEKFVKPHDVQQAAKIVLNEGSAKKCLEMCSAFELSEDNRVAASIVDAITGYMKGKMCGAVEDCREVLSFPWDIPVNQQQVTGRFLSGLVDRLREEDEDRYIEEVSTDDALETIIESYIGEAIFKATTQLHIQQAVIQAYKVKQYLAYLNCITKMCVAKLVRYGSVVEFALNNTKKVVKSCLEAVETKVKDGEFNEGWWKNTEKIDPRRQERHVHSLLHNGRDDSNSTLDDVIIGFERLRRYVRYDLQLAQQEVLAIAALADNEAMKLFHGVSEDEIPERKPLAAYDAWTESEVILRENRRLNSCEKLSKEAREKEKSESEKEASEGVETSDAGVTEISAGSSDASQLIRVHCPAGTSQNSLSSRSQNTDNSSRRLRHRADESAQSTTEDSSRPRSRPPPTPIHYDSETSDSHRNTRMTNLPNQDAGKPTILKRHFQDTSAFDKAIESTATYENSGRRRLNQAESEIFPTKMMLKDGFMHKDPTAQPRSIALKKDPGYLSDNAPPRREEELRRVTKDDKILETLVIRDKDLKISQIVTRESPSLDRPGVKKDSDARSLQPSAEPPPLSNDSSGNNSPIFIEELPLLNTPCPDDDQQGGVSSDDVTSSDAIHSSDAESSDITHDDDAVSHDAISFVTCLSGGNSYCGSEDLSSALISSEETNPPASSSSQDNEALRDCGSIPSSESKETNKDSNHSETEEPTTTDYFQQMRSEANFINTDHLDMEKEFLSAAAADEDRDHLEKKPMKTTSVTVLFSASNTEIPDLNTLQKEVEPKITHKQNQFVPVTRTISVACSLKSTSSDSSFFLSSDEKTNSSSVSLPDLRHKASMEVQFNTSLQSVEHGKALRPSTGVVPYRKTVRTSKPTEDRLKKRNLKRKYAHVHRFGSVFGQLMSTENLPTEGHTKKVLQSKKGKNMLEEVFGKPMSAKEQMNAYHHNIRTLIRNQNGQIFPFWMSQAMQIVLFLICIGSAGWTLFLAFYNESIDDTILYWAVPIAIVTFGFIIEPLKCLAIAWILFLRRKRPAFYNSPLFIKSNPAVMIRSSAMRPKKCGYINRKDMSFYEKVGLPAEDYEEGLYRQYCENRSRPDCQRHQRRRLPALGESDITLDFEKIPTFAEIEEAKFTPYVPKTSSTIVPADDLPQEAETGFRRGALDIGATESKAGFRREAIDRGGSRDVKKDSASAPLKTNMPKRSSSDPNGTLSARIVWCNFATSDEGKPTSTTDNE